MSRHLELVRELKALRKGRGLFAGRIYDRVGPALRATCEITDCDGPAVIRRKLADRLGELIARLPADLGQVSLAAFAIESDARFPLYQDRVHWAAVRLDRDPRTVRRRVDEAINQLAELAADAPVRRACGWRTTELRVAVALDREQPEVLVQRRVVADEDGVRELGITAPIQVTGPRPDIRVFYGGTLVRQDLAADGCAFALALPTSLAKGASHDIAVRFRLPDERALRPHLVCVPPHPCELFDLRVRFGSDRVPPRVWPLSGAYGVDGGEQGCQDRQLPVDRAGEVHLRFRQLVPGLAYGARWESGAGS
ncbi:hypothetical protein [Actinokineospora fastidiosa]|uniref:Uncharacterized protein n=1 Tax=Actinokineospora fastidiosa TaxID=1816 RepID=A0A918GN25_9PSEU|nr:hypothetical protein [Actinokineospora fastidiosa]GGS46535.1 hypothetical protein GCM10010171_47180 [Actinokineospora fastidiosa]